MQKLIENGSYQNWEARWQWDSEIQITFHRLSSKMLSYRKKIINKE